MVYVYRVSVLLAYCAQSKVCFSRLLQEGLTKEASMPRKGHALEEIVAKLHQVDVAVAQGRSIPEAVGRQHRRSTSGRPRQQ